MTITDNPTDLSLAGVISNLQERMHALEQAQFSASSIAALPADPTFNTLRLPAAVVLASTPPIPISGTVTVTVGALFGDTYADFTWTAPSDAQPGTSYQISVAKKDVTGGTYSYTGIYRAQNLTTRIFGLQPNTTYGYVIRSFNPIGIGSTPLPVAGYTDFTTGADITVPSTVTGLALGVGLTTLTISWTASTDKNVGNGAGLYELQVDTSASFNSTAGAPWFGKLSAGNVVAITNTTATTLYYSRVRAITSSGTPGPWSSTVSNTTANGSVGASSDGLVPSSAPTSVTVKSGYNSMFVQWVAIANADPTTYEVHVSTTAGFTPVTGTKVGTVAGTMFNVRSDAAGAALTTGTYYVKVIATDRDGVGPASAEVSGSIAKLVAGDLTPHTITANEILANSITSNEILAGSITGDRITAGTITAYNILGGTITADRLTSGTITAYSGTISSLDASVITVGTMAADHVGAGTITAGQVTIGAGGSIVVGVPSGGSGTGVLVDSFGLRLFSGGTTTVSLNASTGAAVFAGDLTGSNGTFTGTLSAGTVSGGLVTGATLQTAYSGERVVISSSAVNSIVLYPSVALSGPATAAKIYVQTNFTTSFGQDLVMLSGRGSDTGGTGGSESYLVLRAGYGGSEGFNLSAPTSYGVVSAGGELRLMGGQDASGAESSHSVTISTSNGGGLTATVNNIDLVCNGGNGEYFMNAAGNARVGVSGSLFVQDYGGFNYRSVKASAFTVSSLLSSKHNVQPHGYGLRELRKLKTIRFDRPGDSTRIGVIAEDVATHVPHAAEYHHSSEPGDGFSHDPGELFGVDVMGLVSLLIKSLQESDARVDRLEDIMVGYLTTK
jgi:hypothetical protein